MKKENEMLLILETVFKKLVKDYPERKVFSVYISLFLRQKLTLSLYEHKLIRKGVTITDHSLIFTWCTKTLEGKNTEVVISLDIIKDNTSFDVFEEVMYELLQKTRTELNVMLSKSPVVIDSMTSALMRTDLTGMFKDENLPLYNEEDLV